MQPGAPPVAVHGQALSLAQLQVRLPAPFGGWQTHQPVFIMALESR